MKKCAVVLLSLLSILLFADSFSGGGGSGSGGAFVLLEEHTASGLATIDFTTRNVSGQSGATFQSDFDDYQFRLTDIEAVTNGDSLRVRVGTGGGPTFDAGANYNWARFYMQLDSAFTTASAGAAADSAITFLVLASSTTPLSGTLRVSNPASAFSKNIILEGVQQGSDGHQYVNRGAGVYTQSTALTAMRFLMSTGNITGTIRCYGYSH